MQHAGAQGAVFGGHLIHSKTALRPKQRMDFGLGVASFHRSSRATLGFLFSFLVVLRRTNIFDYRAQELLSVIA